MRDTLWTLDGIKNHQATGEPAAALIERDARGHNAISVLVAEGTLATAELRKEQEVLVEKLETFLGPKEPGEDVALKVIQAALESLVAGQAAMRAEVHARLSGIESAIASLAKLLVP